MSSRFLDQVCNARTPGETLELYDARAASYDAEIGENGYVTPKRCAEALAGHLPGIGLGAKVYVLEKL